MSIIIVLYIILGGILFSTIIGGIFVIAWKDIMIAMLRLFRKTGANVYLINPNRTINKYWKVPKDGVFKIKGQTYITNPEKTLNLSEIDKMKVFESLRKTEEKLKLRVLEIKNKIDFIKKIQEETKDKTRKNTYEAEIQRLITIKKTFEGKLAKRINQYFHGRRPAYFYIENDPVPKDMYEYYSSMDGKILDNLISRSISQPAKPIDAKELNFIRLMTIGALIAAAAAAILAFRSTTMLQDICTSLGVACAV